MENPNATKTITTYDFIRQGEETTEEQAIKIAETTDWSKIEKIETEIFVLSTEIIAYHNDIAIYYDSGYDFYLFAPSK